MGTYKQVGKAIIVCPNCQRRVEGPLLVAKRGLLQGKERLFKCPKCHVVSSLDAHHKSAQPPVYPGPTAVSVGPTYHPPPVHARPATVPVPEMPPTMPSGWYADPTDHRAVCWWDGLRWHPETKHYPAGSV